jgi:predicted glycoside hydrolase/deacetylase ChbG (UPF0249 family)
MSIYICADDIGQDPAINDGCLELFYLGRLSQVSLLSLAPHVRSYQQPLLNAHKKGLQIGLHFNLTLHFPSAVYSQPLTRLMYLSQLRLLDISLIRDSFLQQMNAFIDIFGFLPDFIDGHQHVHQFPQIRDVLIEYLLRSYNNASSVWVRSTVLPTYHANLPHPFKCHLLNFLGGNHFIKELHQRSIPHNQGFLGVYDFEACSIPAYRSLMQRWLSLANDQSLIMCHPAAKKVDNDAIGLQRPIEFAYLKSDLFLEDLQASNVLIAK